MSTTRSRIVGLAALLVLAAAVVGCPAVLVAIDAVPMPEDVGGRVSQARTMARSRSQLSAWSRGWRGSCSPRP